MNEIVFIVLVILFFGPLFLIVYSEMIYKPEDENTLVKNTETEDNVGSEPDESYDESDDESNKQMMNFVMMQNMIN